MEISEIKKEAKQTMKGNLLLLFLALFVSGILSNLCISTFQRIQYMFYSGFSINNKEAIEEFFASNDLDFQQILNFCSQTGLFDIIGKLSLIGLLTSLCSFLLRAAFEYGNNYLVLKTCEDGNTNFLNIFVGFQKFAKAFLIRLLQTIYLWLWSLLFIIPAIIKGYSYSMTYYIAIDNPDISANEAITQSRKLMKGHKLQLFALDLSFIGWYILSLFTFFILAIVYVVPYHQTARATFYRDLAGVADADYSNVIEVEQDKL